jgi:phospholipid/cholesterol/gamma-HCH transport system substrate-binding protein
MKFSIRFADQIVGFLIILALVILVFVIFMLGTSQRWFTRDLEYRTFFTSAAGISPNMGVQYRGFTIGHIKRISLAEQDRVEVVFTIFEEYAQRVRIGSLVDLSVSPIGLGSTFSLIPGVGPDLVPEGMVIPALNSPEGKEYIAAGWNEGPGVGTDSINMIMNQVNSLLDTLNISLAGSNGAENLTLGQIILNVETATAGLANLSMDISRQIAPVLSNLDSLMGTINSVLDDVGSLTNQLSEPSGMVMDMLDSQGPLYRNLIQLLESIAGIVDNLERTSDFIPAQLPQVGVLISQLNVTMIMVQDVLTAVANNPLLRGGVPERRETGPGGANPRDMEF